MENPSPRALLILDLDETLFHATRTPLSRPPDFHVGPYAVYNRPGLRGFLLRCAATFELAVWTSATADYADAMLERIKPDGVRFAFVWARERCTRRIDLRKQKKIWIKDLKKVRRRGYPLERVLVVDDSPEKLARQYGNLVRVRPYLGEEADDELVWLETYLAALVGNPNYRRIEKRGWRSGLENRPVPEGEPHG